MSTVQGFRVGQRVIVKSTKEKGRILKRCDRKEWDWWISFSSGLPVPYQNGEIELLPKQDDDTPDARPSQDETH